ncbi:MAG: mercury methylation corrinoid protein HgcA [Syntrophorhabdaceae bacterium]|nr:mercury methylation corrinoid protein HgcA [Syntrophorhabdaceae bacterium]
MTFPLYTPYKEDTPVKDEKEEIFNYYQDFIIDFLETPSGKVPVVDTEIHFEDKIGSWKVRWGIGRFNYRVRPGLYAVGRPNENSLIYVTANYKMSFDRLRKSLSGLNGWIMVLDTDGINVWCAAGKGTFGTDELIRRIELTGIKKIVSHRLLILPQLSAPGVSAHEVFVKTGFKVIYGPVKAEDIKRFLDNGMKATEDMRTVNFDFLDRVVLIPMELVQSIKYILIFIIIMLILHLGDVIKFRFSYIYPFIGAVTTGSVITPALLPWIPGKAFSFKGWVMGLLWAIFVIYKQGIFDMEKLSVTLAVILFLPALSSFLAFNFTGASTYTSLSGVKKEMKIAVPLMITSALTGMVVGITGHFLKF